MNLKNKILLLLCTLLFWIPLNSQSLEYTIKASYLEKFTRFTEWSGNSENEYFVIAVLGESPFKGELEKLASKNKIKTKPVKIVYLKKVTDINNYQLLFISPSEKNRLPEIIDQIENYDMLIVADSPGSCKKGVHFNFYIDNSGTIHYEVNPNALKKSKLIIDMQLLSFGKIVY